jgi:aryl-alcohol dehydrogenase (NADP+)
MSELAKAHAVPNMQVALAWLLRHPAVTSPIIGATKPHHLDDAIAALKVSLSADELERLRKLYKPKPVIDHS